ncbi:MAG: TetR/AcrR family transcriptional regulator [Halanaerobiales bacterium]|nr:TetR/AcrR family transcriptional regulator [Halanaerobiales bacterium]
MPKELFFNINQNKRKKIMQSALKEFSNRIYTEASINKIVQNANISRGSFYQYFEDKQDIYFYIIDTIFIKQSYSYIKKLVADSNNDIYDIFRMLFKFNLQLITESEYSNFFKNLFLSLNYDISRHLNININKFKEELLQKILNNRYRIILTKNEVYAREMINILQLINKNMISKKIVENIGQNKIMELYDIRIRILKNNN